MTIEPVLLKQYKLLCAVIDAPWATRLDHKIARHVIERYFAKFGNARASLRYLERATGSGRNKIIESLRRIKENGVISVIREGVGTRPTEYSLNFAFMLSGAAGGTSTSGAVDGTSTGAPAVTSAVSSGTPDGTKTYLRGMSTDMPTVGKNGPAAAPAGVGLGADPAGSAGDFEELWVAYPRKHQRAKAQAAYKELAPDAGLHAALVAKAAQWAAHYERAATEMRWRKHLHTWLAEESYLEDLPVPFEVANPKHRASTESDRSLGKSGLSSKTPLGDHRVTVLAAKTVKTETDESLTVDYRIQGGPHDGREFTHSFVYDSENEEVRLQGSEVFAEFRAATGVRSPKSTQDFVNCTLIVSVASMGRIKYGAT